MPEGDTRGPVLLLIPVWTAGGAQTSIGRLATVLSHRGVQTHLCTFEDLRDGPVDLPVPVRDLHIGGSPSLVGKVARLRDRIRRIRSLKRRLGITTSISYLDGANFVNLLSAQGEQVIISVRGSQLHDSTIRGPGGFVRRSILMPLLYPRADGVVALNEGIRRELIEHYRVAPHRIRVIRNYFDVAQVRGLAGSPLPEALEAVFHGPVLCFVGRIAPEKGLRGLVHAFHDARRTRRDLRFVLVGDGPEVASLRELARSLGLAEWTWGGPGEPSSADVLFMGVRSNPFPYLARSRALLLNSTSEGGPNVLGEAAILGIPVLSARTPYGPMELLHPEGAVSGASSGQIGDRRGVLLPRLSDTPMPGDLEEWNHAIEQVLQSSEDLDGMRERARTVFEGMDISRLGDAWWPLIR